MVKAGDSVRWIDRGYIGTGVVQQIGKRAARVKTTHGQRWLSKLKLTKIRDDEVTARCPYCHTVSDEYGRGIVVNGEMIVSFLCDDATCGRLFSRRFTESGQELSW